MKIDDLIVEKAIQYIGKRELKGNSGFKDGEFQQLMESVGWQKGQAWCSYFAELIWKQAYVEYKPELLSELNILFSSGAIATFYNFKKSGEYGISKIPKPGALIVWQTYKEIDGKLKPHWTGHIGIVESMYKDVVKTIEGNTNQSGGREGIEVTQKFRDLDFIIKKGLVLKGFIYPKE